MNKFTLLCLSVLLLSFTFSGTHAQISRNGLIGKWDYNGDVGDSSGNGHHGTGSYITYGAGRSGKPNSAGIFDGLGSYVSVPYAADLNLTNFTICATVKIKDFYYGACQVSDILQRGLTNNSGNYGLRFNDTDGTCSIIDTGADCFIGEMGPNNIGFINWAYRPTIRSGRWYSVTETWDGTYVTMWVNGVMVKHDKSTTPSALGTSSDGLYMGASYNSTNSSFPYWYNGMMDEIRLYNRVLADSEISQYYSNIVIAQPYVTSACTNTIFDLPFSLEDTITFGTGTIFTAQLSDATGSFASPLALGSFTVGAAHPLTGNISCKIPATTPPGTGYKIRIVTSNVQFPPTVARNITIATSPTVVVGSNSPLCSGLDSLRLYAAVTGTGSSIIWQWTGPLGYTSNAQFPLLKPVNSANAGNYILKATSTVNGCSFIDTENVIITVDTLPAAPVILNNAPLCLGDTIKLSAASATAGAIYTWTNAAGNTTIGSNFKKLNAAISDSGLYVVTVYNNNCPLKDTITVSVLPDMAPSLTLSVINGSNNWPGALMIFAAEVKDAGNNPVCMWTRNGKLIAGANSDTLATTLLNDNDLLCVKVTSNYLCATPQDTTVCINVKIATGINKLGSSTITVYPNPVSSTLNVAGLPLNTRVQLLDMQGRLMYDQEATQSNMQIPVAKLANGVYMLQLTSVEGLHTSQKIIKE